MDIVILNYNDGAGTAEAVKRAAACSVFDHIIVVDNASTDDSPELLRERLFGNLSSDAAFDAGCTFAGLPGKSEDAQEAGEKIHSGAADFPLEGPGPRSDDPGRRLGKNIRSAETRGNVVLIETVKNGGYGCGNNAGLLYSREVFGSGLAVVANPDSVFNGELIRDMAEVFKIHPDAAAVGAVAVSGGDAAYADLIRSGWKERGVLGSVLNSGPLTSRLFRRALNYPLKYYLTGAKAVRVFAVHGSLLMVNTDRFFEAGGYDENIFLYEEEAVLADRLKKNGFETYLLNETYVHLGSRSITGSVPDAVKRQRLRNTSENYYYKNYLGASAASLFLIRMFQAVVMAETRVRAVFCKSGAS